jgi:hypothetical protein
MTQFPPHQPPSARPVHAEPPRAKPVSLIVFGILNIVFGALGFCGTIGSAAILFLPAQAMQNNPMYEVMQENEGYRMFLAVGSVIGVVMSIVLIVAGIGLIKAANWARLTSIGYAVFTLVYGVIGIVANYIYLVQPMIEQHKPNDPQTAGAISGAIGGLFGSAVGLIYPVVLFIFMLRRSAVEGTRGAIPSGISER